MPSRSLKFLPSIQFYTLQVHVLNIFLYFSIDFGLVCGRLQGLIRACISHSLIVNGAVLFNHQSCGNSG